MNAKSPCVEAPALEPDAAPPLPPRPVVRMRILLADDAPQIRESLSKLLRNAGYHVTLVAHGKQVIDRALEEDFDLVLLDLNMPGLDGWRTLDYLASLKPALPVVIITAQPGQRDWAQAAGARALMEKPLDLPVLLRTIREFTERKAAHPVAARPPTPDRFHLPAPVKHDFRFLERPWRTT